VKPSLWRLAKRRGVFRVAATYLVVAWLILEVGHLLTLILELPHAAMRVVLGGLVLGFPLMLGAAWTFRITADGWLRHVDLPETEPSTFGDHGHEVDGSSHGHGGGHGSGHGGGGFDPLPIILGVMTVGALLLLVLNRSTGGGHAEDNHGAPPPVVAAAAVPAKPPAIAAPANSIAVLPFDNLSGDPGQAFFSDGVAEELRSALAGVAGLQVAARTSSNAFRGGSDTAVMAGKLGVAHILEGSVRRSGSTVRISAQLIDAKTGFERWSETYDRELKDVFAIQSEIAKTVTDAMKVRLLPAEAALLGTAAADISPAAHDAYLRGRQSYDLAADEMVYRSALAQFDAAIAADPAYAAAHAARARTLAAIGGMFDFTAQARDTNTAALAAAERAVALAPRLADGQSALGYVLERSRFDLAGARAAYDRSVASAPGDADILIRYGTFNTRVGDRARGLAALQRAVTLDRFNPRAWRALGAALFAQRRFADALPVQREALRLSPGLSGGHANIGDTLLLLGKPEDARAQYNAETQRWAKLTGLGILEARQGNRAASDAALTALINEFGDTVIYQQAQVRAQRGETAAALDALEKARVVIDPGLLFARNDPFLDRVRKEPRFRALLTKLGAAA
jgi:TolB-like protein/Tfp pilus assembly protein PilF